MVVKKIVKLALIAGGVALAAKVMSAKSSEWQGLTEAQVRDKLDTRLPDAVPAEKRSAVADKVVSKMRARGKLLDESDAGATDQPES
jgi:hypothetical protein